MLSFTNIDAVFQGIHAPWSPVEVARLNDHVVLAAIFHGEYHWHTHEYDELFFVVRGSITIQLKGHPSLTLSAGELGVVPKGVEHCPKATEPAHVLMVEPG